MLADLKPSGPGKARSKFAGAVECPLAVPFANRDSENTRSLPILCKGLFKTFPGLFQGNVRGRRTLVFRYPLYIQALSRAYGKRFPQALVPKHLTVMDCSLFAPGFICRIDPSPNRSPLWRLLQLRLWCLRLLFPRHHPLYPD